MQAIPSTSATNAVGQTDRYSISPGLAVMRGAGHAVLREHQMGLESMSLNRCGCDLQVML